MLFKNIALLDDKMNVSYDMYVAVEGSKISYVGSKEPDKDYGDTYDGRNKLMMPAFVNSHGHTPMTLMRGYGENMVLDDWLNSRIFPFEAKLRGEDIYWATLLGIAEMVRFGIVSVTDMYYFGEDMVRAVSEGGVKSNLSLAVTCFDDSHLRELPVYGEMKSLFENYNDSCDGRVKIDLSVHAEYTSTERVVREMAETAANWGTGMHVHLSETKKEHEECKLRRGGMTPAQYFDSLGLFDVRTTAAHCLYVENEDYDILRAKKVTAATCPKSNLKLASGIFDAHQMYKRGINIALGTDSVASNNSLNMIEEIRTYALLQKCIHGDPTLITPTDAIYAATRAGALAQGRDDAGIIREGFRADLAVIDISAPYMQPVHDLMNNVLYSATGTDVCLTMADGKVIYRDNEFMTIDVERVSCKVKEAVKRILSL